MSSHLISSQSRYVIRKTVSRLYFKNIEYKVGTWYHIRAKSIDGQFCRSKTTPETLLSPIPNITYISSLQFIHSVSSLRLVHFIFILSISSSSHPFHLSIALNCASCTGPNPLHPANAPLPKVPRPSGRVTSVRLEHRLKAELPMEMTLSGMAMDVSFEHQ